MMVVQYSGGFSYGTGDPGGDIGTNMQYSSSGDCSNYPMGDVSHVEVWDSILMIEPKLPM